MNPFIAFLENRLSKSLPGVKAQLKMAPEPVDNGPGRELDPEPGARKSSVLILLFPNEDEDLELLLTLRSRDIDHGGQISLPGGRSDKDEAPEDTALRETQEEVGINPSSIQLLGTLSSLYVSHSKNHVIPVVGYLDSIPALSLNTNEVEEAFTVEVESLAKKKNLTVEDWNLRRYTYKVPYWDVHRVPLWGATAMILSEFLELYREFKTISKT
ncbi:MAG: CoA pyrophosphatase [Balneolaceae bacterium]|nr:CoA pyrophosphatase [Balneolaceae bacterium]